MPVKRPALGGAGTGGVEPVLIAAVSLLACVLVALGVLLAGMVGMADQGPCADLPKVLSLYQAAWKIQDHESGGLRLWRAGDRHCQQKLYNPDNRPVAEFFASQTGLGGAPIFSPVPYVACVKLTDGLGNRVFQLLALLAYCQRTGRHRPVVYSSDVGSNPHGQAMQWQRLFPYVETRPGPSPTDAVEFPETSSNWSTPLPDEPGNVRILGYRQSEKHFASSGYLPVLDKALRTAACKVLEAGGIDPRRAMFVHVRRGDFVNSWLFVDLSQYYRNCAAALSSDLQGLDLVLLTNDAEWALKNVAPEFSGARALHCVGQGQPDIEVLATMAACRRGGVCANSSMSWLGAFLARACWNTPDNPTTVFMPSTWIPGGGCTATVGCADRYPSWATVIPV
jgi:hypothetical protein